MPFDMEMDEYHEDIKMRNDNMKNILITGVSSGLGKALMEEYTNQGHTVYGITREDINLENVEEVNIKLPNILKGVNELDVVDALNTGKLTGYGTDVIENEFDDITKSPIIKAMNEGKNIIATPHIGGMTIEGQTKAYKWSIDKL